MRFNTWYAVFIGSLMIASTVHADDANPQLQSSGDATVSNYLIDLNFDDPGCGTAQRRIIVVEKSIVTVQGRDANDACSGPLASDGGFSFGCGKAGINPTFYWSGKIDGPNVSGQHARWTVFVSQSLDINRKCTATFAGHQVKRTTRPSGNNR